MQEAVSIERPDFHYEIVNRGKTVMITPIREAAKDFCRNTFDEHWKDGVRVRTQQHPKHGRSYLFHRSFGDQMRHELATKRGFIVERSPTPWAVHRK